jgi:hypothetical protein
MGTWFAEYIVRNCTPTNRLVRVDGLATHATTLTSMGKKREVLNHWQRVAQLILAKEDVLTVSRALELALFYDAKLDVTAGPTATLIPN